MESNIEYRYFISNNAVSNSYSIIEKVEQRNRVSSITTLCATMIIALPLMMPGTSFNVKSPGYHIMNKEVEVFSKSSDNEIQSNLLVTPSFNENDSFVFDFGKYGDDKVSVSMERLIEISELNINWNGLGALPFSSELMSKAASILKFLDNEPDVFPTGRNSIQFEYESKNGQYLELEVFEDRIESLYISQNGEESASLIEFNEESIKKVVSKFEV